MLKQPKVCVIIPFYNGDHFIRPCIESILKNNYPNLTICIVNNSSAPTNIQNISHDYNDVVVIDAPPKLGFSRANNKGAEFALSINAEYMIILNQDTLFSSDTIRALIEPFHSDENLAITAPIPFTYDFTEIEEHFIRWYLTLCPQLFYDSLQNEPKRTYYIKEVSGACFAIKSEVVNSFGLFDPLYFMYMEDMDLCRKINYLKKVIAIAPYARIAHAHSNTDDDLNKKRAISFQTRRSRGIFVLKDYSKSFLFNFVKLIRLNLEDYVNCLTKFSLGRLWAYLIIDFKVVFEIRKIINSRKKDMRCAEKSILHTPESVAYFSV